jgi:multiple sugar transport system permease protein
MVSLSFKPESEIYTPGYNLLPVVWDFANYVEAFGYGPPGSFSGEAGNFIANGWIVTLSILLFQYAVSIPAAYILATKNFQLNGILFSSVLVVLLIPPHVTAIPVYLMLGKVGLLNTIPALVIPFTVSAFGIFLFRQSFKTIPRDLLDAARVDGASEFNILWTIVVPLALPTMAAFGIFSIVVHWNDFFWPLLVIYDMEKATPPLGISIFASDEGGNDVGPMMASATVIVMPLVIVFLIARKWFIEGITMTGIKG